METREGKQKDPYAIRYPLGWTIIGPLNKGEPLRRFNTHFIQAQEKSLEEQMSRLWSTDFTDPPSSKCGMSVEDKKALEIMENTAHLDKDSHWCIRLPWKEDPPDLPNNR